MHVCLGNVGGAAHCGVGECAGQVGYAQPHFDIGAFGRVCGFGCATRLCRDSDVTDRAGITLGTYGMGDILKLRASLRDMEGLLIDTEV